MRHCAPVSVVDDVTMGNMRFLVLPFVALLGAGFTFHRARAVVRASPRPTAGVRYVPSHTRVIASPATCSLTPPGFEMSSPKRPRKTHAQHEGERRVQRLRGSDADQHIRLQQWLLGSHVMPVREKRTGSAAGGAHTSAHTPLFIQEQHSVFFEASPAATHGG